ncbi:MAG: response regulator [Fimbriimonadia bacterium]|nr:response regulator [Fimbriimonadia bacterium]
MNKIRVLVVDDERPIRRFLTTALSADDYEIFEAETGQDTLKMVISAHPDIIILDLGLPDMDGAEVLRRLREWSQVPVIVLSVREQETVKIAALDHGADDYLTKPFGIGELQARMRVALRRSLQSAPEPVFRVGDLEVDLALRQVLFQKQKVSLTPTEYDILKCLVTHAGKVLTHRHLLREIWGPLYEEETHMLRVNISNLRKKIEPDPAQPRYLITEPGVGYRLKAEM